MEALILAAGYAVRLHPLTLDCAKPLLQVGDQPLIDHILDRVLLLEDVSRIHVVANDRFYHDFVAWAADKPDAARIQVWNDGTFDNSDRRGAIGDAEWVIEQGAIDDDLLIVAGDNLFDFDLRGLRAQQLAVGTSIVTYLFPRPELIPKYSTVEVDTAGRVVAFTEKPAVPTTNRIGICCYLFDRADVPRVKEYLVDGNNPDAPGYFIQWLHQQVPVHAFEFEGLWFDIGDHASLLEADNALRLRCGLTERAAYEHQPAR